VGGGVVVVVVVLDVVEVDCVVVVGSAKVKKKTYKVSKRAKTVRSFLIFVSACTSLVIRIRKG